MNFALILTLFLSPITSMSQEKKGGIPDKIFNPAGTREVVFGAPAFFGLHWVGPKAFEGFGQRLFRRILSKKTNLRIRMIQMSWARMIDELKKRPHTCGLANAPTGTAIKKHKSPILLSRSFMAIDLKQLLIVRKDKIKSFTPYFDGKKQVIMEKLTNDPNKPSAIAKGLITHPLLRKLANQNKKSHVQSLIMEDHNNFLKMVESGRLAYFYDVFGNFYDPQKFPRLIALQTDEKKSADPLIFFCHQDALGLEIILEVNRYVKQMRQNKDFFRKEMTWAMQKEFSPQKARNHITDLLKHWEQLGTGTMDPIQYQQNSKKTYPSL